MTEFDFIAHARKVLPEIDPRRLGWVAYPTIGRKMEPYPAIDLGFDGYAWTISEPYCGPGVECGPQHECAGDVFKVGAEECEECSIPPKVAEFVANAPDMIRALLAELDRLNALYDLTDDPAEGQDFDSSVVA